MRTRLLVALVVLLLAAPAGAESASQVALGLRSGPVYQAPGLSLVDAAALAAELTGTDPQVDVAVVRSAQPAEQQAAAVLAALGDPELVVLVITADQRLAAVAGKGAVARGVDAAGGLAQELAAAPPGPFDRVQLTALAGAFAERVAGQVSGDGPDITRTVPPAASPVSGPPPSAAARSSHVGVFVISGLVAALALGGLLVRRRRT